MPPLGWWAAARALPQLRRFALVAATGITFQGSAACSGTSPTWQNGSRCPSRRASGRRSCTSRSRSARPPPGSAFATRCARARRRWTTPWCSRPAPASPSPCSRTSYGPAGRLASLDAAFRPVVNVLLVTLIASAALGRWQGLPLPVGLLALGQLFSAAGDLLFGYYTARDAYVDDRWTNLLWLTGAVIAIVTATSLILRIDRPIRLTRRALPGVSPLALLLATVGAWGIAAAVAVYGALNDHPAALYAGLAAGAWIGLAAPLRTLSALQETRAAYQRLDEAHLRLEQAGDRAARLVRERDATIAQLAQRNVELTAIQAMLGSLFELADERSDGELRSRLEETAEEITAWLPPPEPGDVLARPAQARVRRSCASRSWTSCSVAPPAPLGNAASTAISDMTSSTLSSPSPRRSAPTRAADVFSAAAASASVHPSTAIARSSSGIAPERSADSGERATSPEDSIAHHRLLQLRRRDRQGSREAQHVMDRWLADAAHFPGLDRAGVDAAQLGRPRARVAQLGTAAPKQVAQRCRSLSHELARRSPYSMSEDLLPTMICVAGGTGLNLARTSRPPLYVSAPPRRVVPRRSLVACATAAQPRSRRKTAHRVSGRVGRRAVWDSSRPAARETPADRHDGRNGRQWRSGPGRATGVVGRRVRRHPSSGRAPQGAKKRRSRLRVSKGGRPAMNHFEHLCTVTPADWRQLAPAARSPRAAADCWTQTQSCGRRG